MFDLPLPRTEASGRGCTDARHCHRGGAMARQEFRAASAGKGSLIKVPGRVQPRFGSIARSRSNAASNRVWQKFCASERGIPPELPRRGETESSRDRGRARHGVRSRLVVNNILEGYRCYRSTHRRKRCAKTLLLPGSTAPQKSRPWSRAEI